MDAKTLSLYYVLLGLHTFTFCISTDTIIINQTIREGDLLISKQNKFALGFFSPGNSSYRYLGIWFFTLPLQTVVWVANRNHPIIGSAGVLSINQYGNLVLYGNRDEEVPVWSTNVSMDVADACVAHLLDSGNLVLVQGISGRIVWQSFDYPTNTFLPGMKLGLDRKTGLNWFLTSWRSTDDPGIGVYLLKLNPIGSPQFFLYEGSKPYWRGTPWPWRPIPIIYNFSFVNNEEEISFSYSLDDSSVLFRMVLEESGMLMWVSWHESDGQWKEFWSASKYRCDSYGRCGANSMCDPNHVNTFECSCLPGYEPKSSRNWVLMRDGSGGCVRKRLKSSSVCRQGEGFVKVPQVKIPDTSTAVWVNTRMTRLDCERECYKNCSCSAYASIKIPGKEVGCLAWYGDLMDIVALMDHSGYDVYVRVDAIELAEIARSNGFLEMKGMLAFLVVSVSSAWFAIIIFAYLWLRKRKKRVKNKSKKRLFDSISGSHYDKDTLEANELQASRSHPDLAFFNLSTIFAATDNFSQANKIGQGGFGSVYKGQLTNGKKVAVKRLSKNSGQGIEEFKNEAMLIAKLQHRNLVKLLGCCIQGEERILIYEYLPNGSLDLFLFDPTRSLLLNWSKRFEIIVGIARGILYLHQDSRLRIIHRDLKSSNILLDLEMNPKISDFGMARILKGDQIQHKTHRVVGTYGYMSPEYAVFGKFSIKSDVFSFGVILLEIISGKKSNGFHQEDPSLTLIGHVWELWKEGRALEMVDSTLKEAYNSHEVMKCIRIALLCVQEDAMDRPTISAIILMLDSEIDLPYPKQPAFIFRTSCSSSSIWEGRSSINEVTITETGFRDIEGEKRS
ncbi:G-type lectin S-receptor-like serine/threonine-protein kinase RKS1 isoform X1 [Hevea brasiliensis]|uniref:G-type lectin S-receptor-like serine/threonine-protein kinase RKS1 isoform X1 n=1 Tax=Hevea brasiliensis TaxID=3981 RepID=UPI0025EA3B77|nr:G-type lectin S-receptor-like serine/threonine-protein kinase RKS1 isoform X1 [Hevea brasiliensis]